MPVFLVAAAGLCLYYLLAMLGLGTVWPLLTIIGAALLARASFWLVPQLAYHRARKELHD